MVNQYKKKINKLNEEVENNQIVIKALTSAKTKLKNDLDFEKEENEKTQQIYSTTKIQMKKLKSDLENQEMLVKVLEKTKLKLKGENDKLKEQVAQRSDSDAAQFNSEERDRMLGVIN